MKYETKDGGVATVADGSPAGVEIVGYGAWFNNIDLGGDRILPGAFSKTLTHRPSVVFLWQHEVAQPIGRTTLLHEDQHGLFFKAYIAPTSVGNDARVLIKSGALSAISIGYNPIKPKFKDGVRELGEIDLLELSVVTFGMNPMARLAANSGKMADVLAIGEFEALKATGCPIPSDLMLKAVEAEERQVQRLENEGQTWQEVKYKMLFEIQEALKELKELSR